MTDLTDAEDARLPFSEDEALSALAGLDKPSGEKELLDKLFDRCRDVSTPYRRDRQGLFNAIEELLTKVYRKLCIEMIHGSFPLVIVDEAHHWKNGPKHGANGFEAFRTLIAERTRRLLLLTATPFQLRPDEMLEILRVTESLEYASTEARSSTRKARLTTHCNDSIAPALEAAQLASKSFSEEWAATQISTEQIAAIWSSPSIADARAALAAAGNPAKSNPDELKRVHAVDDNSVA